MATINYWLDSRRDRADQTYPLKVVVSNKGTKAYLPLPPKFSFSKDEWSSDLQQVKRNHPKYRQLNNELNTRMDEMQERLEEFGVCPPQSASVIARKLMGIRGEDDKLFTAVFEEYSKLVTRKSSHESYEYTLRTIRKYDKHADELRFDDVDFGWLCGFRDAMYEQVSKNTTAIHLENMRAVFNYAIQEDITQKYPFKKFRIKREKVKPQVMTKKSLRSFLAYKPAYESQNYYHDYWCLIFGLCGINVADLYVLRDDNFKNGRIEYNRQKTGVFVSIKVEPEVMEILRRRKGKNGMLLDLSEKWPCGHKPFVLRMNRSIKTWGPWQRVGRAIKTPFHPWEDVTSYTARRQWATTAGELGIPEYIINAGLGHSEGSMTSHYITVREEQLDEANRKVLDYVGFADNKCRESIVDIVCQKDNALKLSEICAI